jgi:ubiquinone biosynthesis monooxygenase Coq7
MQLLDKFIIGVDSALRAVTGASGAVRQSPASDVIEQPLSVKERQHSAGLMRVNHVGEVCAQALYEAQGCFADGDQARRLFMQAKQEEEDHLAWTTQRIRELGSHTSWLNPLWYAGAFALGAIAARSGDARSLGFVAETERQVEAHLASHLETLPAQDAKSRAIVEQMRIDEIAHGAAADALGAAHVPQPVRKVMHAMAKVMTSTAYYI